MYNLAIRKRTSPPLPVPKLKIFKRKFTTSPGIEPRTHWTRGRHATILSSPVRSNLLKFVYVQNVSSSATVHSQRWCRTEWHTIWSVANGIYCNWWHIQSDLSVPPVFVVLWCTPCSLKFPKGRNLEGLNREMRPELHSTSSLSYPSLIECAIEKNSHIDMKVRRSPVLLEINLIFILKEIFRTWNHDLQHL